MRTATTLILLAASASGMGAGPSCPTAIRETIPGIRYSSDPAEPKPAFTSMRGIHEAMLKCPNITTLQVRTALIGCSEWPDRFNFPFDARGGEQYASAPAILSLDGYKVDESEWNSCRDRFTYSWDTRLSFLSQPSTIWPCLRHLLLPAAQRNKTNFDLWLDAMDFSRIHTLQLNNTQGGGYMLTKSVAKALGPKLHSLESLLVHNAVAEKLMLALPDDSLRHLSWQSPLRGCGDGSEHNAGGESPLQRVLARHGPTLQSLEYRTEETDSRAPPVLHLDELHALGTLAPKLANLTVNLGRENNGMEIGQQWPWEKLKVVAESLTELTDLTMYFALGSECHRQRQDNPWHPVLRCDGSCIGPDRYAQPMLNKTSAAGMARFLWQHKAGQQFKSITFRTGDWSPPWDGPLAFEGWLDGQRAWVTCTTGGSQSNSEGKPDDRAHADITCDGGDTLTLAEWRDYCRGWSSKGVSVEQEPMDL